MVIWMTEEGVMTKQEMKIGILNNMALLSYKLSIWQSYLQIEKEGWKYKYWQKNVQQLLGKNWEVVNRGRDNHCRSFTIITQKEKII